MNRLDIGYDGFLPGSTVCARDIRSTCLRLLPHKGLIKRDPGTGLHVGHAPSGASNAADREARISRISFVLITPIVQQ